MPATLVDKPQSARSGCIKIKWDGYRVSVYIADGKATVRTRNGLDWTSRVPAIAAAAERLPRPVGCDRRRGGDPGREESIKLRRTAG